MNILSSVGLIFDMTGVFILYRNGLPSNINDDGGALLADGETSDEEEQRKNKNKKIRRYARIGLALIFVGFIFQFAGTIFPLTNNTCQTPSQSPIPHIKKLLNQLLLK
jgi:hypothetical protein